MHDHRKQSITLILLLTLCLAMATAFAVSSIANALIFSSIFLASLTIWQHQQILNAQKLLHQSTLSHTFLNQQLAIIECDSSGHITEANENALTLAEQAGKKVIGKSMNDVFPEDSDAMLAKNISNSIEISVPVDDASRPLLAERHTTDTGFIFFLKDLSDKKALEELNITDSLTKVRNRRAFESEISNMTNRAQRQDQYLTLAIIDIDQFSDFNEQFGHEEGNKALVKLADSLRHTLRRATDHIYRIENDEFVAVFEGDSPAICRRAIENLIAEFENHHLPNPTLSGEPYLTLSAGAFGARGKQLGDSDQLYLNADIQLFNAKETGNSFNYLFPEIGRPICVEPLAKRLEAEDERVI